MITDDYAARALKQVVAWMGGKEYAEEGRGSFDKV
ncbi:MAG: hypothetical protein RIQ50_492 [Bacteroidota bacterium]|jgi:hypothetical protein